MPRLALQLLQRRLERSGLLDQIASDARILFRKRLRFIPRDDTTDEAGLSVELLVGTVLVGHLYLSPLGAPHEKGAFLRWLELVARDLGEHLSSPHAHAREVLPSNVAEAARILRERYQDPLTLATVARAVNLSRERLSRLFHETLGITFSEYLNHARLEAARTLLRSTNKSITEIAFESGFQSLSQFHRRFRSAENKSPSAFREGT